MQILRHQTEHSLCGGSIFSYVALPYFQLNHGLLNPIFCYPPSPEEMGEGRVRGRSEAGWNGTKIINKGDKNMKISDLCNVVDGFTEIRIFESIEQEKPIYILEMVLEDYPTTDNRKYMDKEIKWILASDVQQLDVVIG